MSDQTDIRERDYVRNLFYIMFGVYGFMFTVPISIGANSIVGVIGGTLASSLVIAAGVMTKFYK